MPNSSLLQTFDLAIKTTLYTKFAPTLGIDIQSSSEEENINLGIFQFPKEVAQRIASEKRGATFLEYINFWRTRVSFSWERNRTPLSRRGMWIGDGMPDGRNTIHVKAIPVDLSYDAWFWSKDLDKLYQITEDYAFWQQDNPKISLEYEDIEGNTYELTPDIHLGEIIDESTVDSQYSTGLIYVCRMPITVDAWVLKGLTWKTINKIRVTFYDKDDVTNYSEIVVEDGNQDTELEAALRYFRRSIYDIYEVDLATNSVSITGSFAADFVVGDKITIWNSAGNDGVYTVSSDGATYADNKTTVILDEALVSTTADGTIYKGE